MPGATNSLLVLANLQSWQSGAYTIVVANGAGATTTQLAMLDVGPMLALSLVPAVSLKGDVGSTYRLDYVNAPGPTGAWNTLTTITLASNPQLDVDFSAIVQPQRFYRMVQMA